MDAMDELYKKHSKMIYYFLLSRIRDADTAEELTQETFYQAIRSVNSFQGKSRVSTWLCGIANNVFLVWQRQQNKATALEEVEGNLSTGYLESPLLIKWDTKEILKQLHSLNEPTREVMYLRLIGNLSFNDIGEIMGKSENWARVNFYRGKERIIEGVRKNEEKNFM